MEHDPAIPANDFVNENITQPRQGIFGRFKGWLQKLLDNDIFGNDPIDVKHFGAAGGYPITIGEPAEVQKALEDFLQRRAPR